MRALPRALRHRDYALLWAGQTVSVVGDGIYTVAIALEALLIADARQGLRWTVRQRWLWFSMLGAGVCNFAAFAPTAVTLPLIVRDAGYVPVPLPDEVVD
jgi:hypothetical protein